MEEVKIYILTLFAFLGFNFGISQENERHIIKSPTKEIKMILYSNGKPIVEGYVITVGNKLINHGMFIVYEQNGFILRTVHYDMGKIVKITNFNKEEKI